MTDRPILFSGPMVRAILAGCKTQTRRVAPDGGLHSHLFRLGDRLWVREAWATHAAYDDLSPSAMGGDEPIRYAADGAHQTWGHPAISKLGRPRVGIHMPRWASRLTLTVTALRGQRLQDINEADAEAEGITKHGRFWGVADADWDSASTESAVQAYANLWDDLNAARGYGWDSNPWVVAITFDVEQRNIDQ